MRESQLRFEYTWADLQGIRALAITVILAQCAGMALGLIFAPQSTWLLRAWFGGALNTFPAFLIGLAIQWRAQAGSIRRNRVLVRRVGLLALLLSAIAVAMPMMGF